MIVEAEDGRKRLNAISWLFVDGIDAQCVTKVKMALQSAASAAWPRRFGTAVHADAGIGPAYRWHAEPRAISMMCAVARRFPAAYRLARSNAPAPAIGVAALSTASSHYQQLMTRKLAGDVFSEEYSPHYRIERRSRYHIAPAIRAPIYICWHSHNIGRHHRAII